MDEKKTYSVVGTVSIWTDEYRDLIEERASFKKDADEYRSKFWKEESARKSEEAKVKALEAQLEDYRAFLDKYPEAKALFGQYTAEKALAAIKAQQ